MGELAFLSFRLNLLAQILQLPAPTEQALHVGCGHFMLHHGAQARSKSHHRSPCVNESLGTAKWHTQDTGFGATKEQTVRRVSACTFSACGAPVR